MGAHTHSHLSCCAGEAGKANDGTEKNEEKENVYEQQRLFVEKKATTAVQRSVWMQSWRFVTWMDEICFTQANASGWQMLLLTVMFVFVYYEFDLV